MTLMEKFFNLIIDTEINMYPVSENSCAVTLTKQRFSPTIIFSKNFTINRGGL